MPSANQQVTRQSTSSSSSSSPRSSNHSIITTNWITFQFNHSCVFVKPAETHEEAVSIARKEFDQLATINQDRIAFTVEEKPQDKQNVVKRHVRISESAWPAVITRLHQGAIVNVVVRLGSDEKPPQYLEVPTTSTSGRTMKRMASNSSCSVKSTKSASGLLCWINGRK